MGLFGGRTAGEGGTLSQLGSGPGNSESASDGRAVSFGVVGVDLDGKAGLGVNEVEAVDGSEGVASSTRGGKVVAGAH